MKGGAHAFQSLFPPYLIQDFRKNNLYENEGTHKLQSSFPPYLISKFSRFQKK